jgi:F420-dependent oxidoreductase-like protein
MSVKFGVIVPQGWRLDLTYIPDPVEKYAQMTRYAREAERLELDSIWLYDHFHTVPTQELETTFECWMCTAALARDTERIRIGQMVTCNHYRNPALLAKMASTADVMSNGRLDFGIGAGWYEEEFTAYGYPFPDGPERLRMLDEALHVIKAMWTEPYATFEGQYYTVKGAINEPKGVQKPHIPIWLGGGGEKVTLKLVAKHAQACNVVGNDPEVVKHKLGVLREHCERLGRDYGSIIKSAHTFMVLQEQGQSLEDAIVGHPYLTLESARANNICAEPAEIQDRLGALVDAGVEYFIFYIRNRGSDLDALSMLVEDVLPAVRG